MKRVLILLLMFCLLSTAALAEPVPSEAPAAPIASTAPATALDYTTEPPETAHAIVQMYTPDEGLVTRYFALPEGMPDSFKGKAKQPVAKVGSGVRYAVPGKLNDDGDLQKLDGRYKQLIDLAAERCGYLLPNKKALKGITEATLSLKQPGEDGMLVTVSEQSLTDAEKLLALEKLLARATSTKRVEGDFGAVLTLTNEAGARTTVYLAADGSGKLVLGSNAFFSVNKKTIQAVWDMFPDVEPHQATDAA